MIRSPLSNGESAVRRRRDANEQKCSKTTTPRFDSRSFLLAPSFAGISRWTRLRSFDSTARSNNKKRDESGGNELESDSLAGTTTEKRWKSRAAAARSVREDPARSPAAAAGRVGDIGELARVDENDGESTAQTAHSQRSTALLSVSARGNPLPTQISRRADRKIRFELVGRRTEARRQRQQGFSVSCVSVSGRAAREQKVGEIRNQKPSERRDGSRHRVRHRVGEWCIGTLCVPSWSECWSPGAGWRQTGTNKVEFTPASMGSLDAQEWEESLEYVCCDTTGHVGQVVNQSRQLLGCAEHCFPNRSRDIDDGCRCCATTDTGRL